mgnify:CR=1 FL=1
MGINAKIHTKNLCVHRAMRDLAKFSGSALVSGLLLVSPLVSAGTFSVDLTTNISQAQYDSYTSGALQYQGAFLSEEWSGETVLFDGETVFPGIATLTFTVNNGDGLYQNTGFNNAGPTLSPFGAALFYFEALGLIEGNQSLNDADFTGLNVFVDAIPDGLAEEENSPNYQGGVTVDFSLALPEGFGSGTEPLLFDNVTSSYIIDIQNGQLNNFFWAGFWSDPEDSQVLNGGYLVAGAFGGVDNGGSGSYLVNNRTDQIIFASNTSIRGGAAVPEPGTLGLGIAGLLALVGRRRP